MWCKICGLQTEENARRLARLPVDALGINRVRTSSRFVDREKAARLVHLIHRENPDVEIVGVYVDAPVEEILRDREQAGIETAQLHGDESPREVEQLIETMDVIKAFRVGEDFAPGVMDEYACRRQLLDAYHPEQHGGSGKTAPWHRIREWTGERRIVLAGGLDPGNIRRAITEVQPWGVDVCSGVEDGSGLKDPEAAATLVEEVKDAT